jgi:hypothetical protein
MTFFSLFVLIIYLAFIEFYHIKQHCQGTGSYPNPPPGLQRDIRLIPIYTPRNMPYFSMACFVYSLQVGVNLHAARPPVIGDIAN